GGARGGRRRLRGFLFGRRGAPGRRDDGAARRLRAAGRRRARLREDDPRREDRPARLRAAPERCPGDRRGRRRPGLRWRGRRVARGPRRAGRRRREADHARPGDRRRERRSALVAGPVERGRRRRADPGAAGRRGRRRRVRVRRPVGEVRRADPRARRPDRVVHVVAEARAAQARHEPRRVRLLRSPVRHRRPRLDHPRAVDERAGIRGRRAQARGGDQARERADDLPRDVLEPAARAGRRAGVGRQGRARAVRGHRGAGRDLSDRAAPRRRRDGGRVRRRLPAV
ncbi:MAG: Zinc ABC transporter, substrate-binding protein ZnuA, partial [uncultured Solirubrobacteraceae bacterium]